MPDADPPVSLPDTGRQYHIDLAPRRGGGLHPPARRPGPHRPASRRSSMTVEVQRRHREFHSVTGMHRGLRVSVVSTGIGADNVEIVMAEILAITQRPTFVRIGSCGVLREDIALGDLVITTGAVRLEATTTLLRRRRLPGRGRLRGRGRARGGGRPHRPSCPPGHHRHGAGLLRRPGPAHPAAAICASRTSPTDGRARASSTSRWRPPRCSCWRPWRAAAPASSARPIAQRTSGRVRRGRAARSGRGGPHRDRAWRRSTCWPRWTSSGHAAGELHWRPSHWAPKVAP